MELSKKKTRRKKKCHYQTHTDLFINHRKEVIVTLSIHRLGLLLQTAEELSWCLPSWVILHMDNFPPVQDTARGKSKVKVFANVLTYHEGSALNTPDALSLTD